MKLVRPEEGAPKISVIAPRGSPAITESTVAIPVAIISAGGFWGLKGAPNRLVISASNVALDNATRMIYNPTSISIRVEQSKKCPATNLLINQRAI